MQYKKEPLLSGSFFDIYLLNRNFISPFDQYKSNFISPSEPANAPSAIRQRSPSLNLSILRHEKTDETQSSVYMNYSSFSLLRPLREDLRYDIRPERRPDRQTRRAFF